MSDEEVNNEKRDKASVSNLVGAFFIGRGNDLPWEKKKPPRLLDFYIRMTYNKNMKSIQLYVKRI